MEQPWAVREHYIDVGCPCLPAVCDERLDGDERSDLRYYHDANVARVRHDADGHP